MYLWAAKFSIISLLSLAHVCLFLNVICSFLLQAYLYLLFLLYCQWLSCSELEAPLQSDFVFLSVLQMCLQFQTGFLMLISSLEISAPWRKTKIISGTNDLLLHNKWLQHIWLQTTTYYCVTCCYRLTLPLHIWQTWVLKFLSEDFFFPIQKTSFLDT